MPTGPKGQKRPADVTSNAVRVMRIAAGEEADDVQGGGMTPAMAAGVSKTLWSMDDLCEKMDAVAPKPGKRGPYKKHAA